jgi:hypothetical protein
MGSLIVFTGMLFVFFVRDVLLFSITPRPRLLPALGIYGVLNAIGLAFLASIVASEEPSGVLRQLHASLVWIPCVAWHGLIWLFCVALSRRGRADWGWLAVVLPSPVLLVSMSTVSVLVWQSLGSPQITPVAFAMAVCWWAAIAAAVLYFQRKPGSASEQMTALRFAGMSNVTALLLVPLFGLLQGG